MSHGHYPLPKHLRQLLVVDCAKSGEHEVFGSIRCECGSETFNALFVGERNEEEPKHFLQIANVDGHWFFLLGASCAFCRKQFLLFDMEFHGWNGYVCGDEEKRKLPRPPFHEWKCQNCHSTAQKISVTICGEDMEFALGEGEGVLTEADWFEGFGWLCLDVTCTSCGLGPTRIVDYETM